MTNKANDTGTVVLAICAKFIESPTGAYWELFHTMVFFVSTFMAIHHLSNTICNISSVKSRIKICSSLAEYITSSEDVSMHFAAAMEKQFEGNTKVELKRI
jgi:hypothetical protein